MAKNHNPHLTGSAQNLRKRQTPEEKHLWFDFLKPHSVTFHRQKVIGPFIVDFYCASAKLVIELDGSQHFTEEGLAKDRERDLFLSKLGLKVLRYSNYDFHHNFEGICQDIDMHIKERQ